MNEQQKKFRKWKFYSIFSRINKNAVFFLGNQKSGTSAISWLVSQATDLSLTMDIIRNVNSSDWQLQVKRGDIGLADWMKIHSYEFSQPLIKEPALTLFTSELISLYPKAKYVFIVRDPRDNIRSILNRLKLSGNINGWTDLSEQKVTNKPAWLNILNSDWLTDENSHGFIESLAHRWNYCCSQYIANKDKIIFIKYEDFIADKNIIINELVEKLQLPIKTDITSLVDTQLQSKGDNSQTWGEFFGEPNLLLINKLTATNRDIFNY